MQAYEILAANLMPRSTRSVWRSATQFLLLCLAVRALGAAQVVVTTLPSQGSSSAVVVDQIGLAINAAVQPAAGTNAANYRLAEAGADRIFGTGDDFAHTVRATVAGTNVLVQFNNSPLQPGRYRFETLAGLLDATGAGISPFSREFELIHPTGGLIESINNNQLEQATALPVAESPAGSKFYSAVGLGAVSNADDLDFWRFEAEAGDRITVRIIADPANAQPQMQLRNAANGVVTSAGSSGGVSLLQDFRIPSPGTHYVRVGGARFGTYTLRLDQARGPQLETEPNDTVATADAGALKILSGGYSLSVAGSLESGDPADLISLGHLTAGNNLSINALFPAGSTLPGQNLIVRVLREGGTQPEATTGDGTLNFNTLSSGVHYVSLSAQNGTGFRGQYLLNVEIGDGVAPVVSGISLPAEGTSSREIIQDFNVQFSEDMNPVMIKSSANYELRNAGRDGRFNTDDDQLYRVANEDYEGGLAVRFTLPDGPLQAGNYTLRINTGINDRAGNPLAAAVTRSFSVEADTEFPIEGRNNTGFAGASPVGVVTAAPDFSFTPVLNVPVGSGAYSVDNADFNRDGNPDAVVANYYDKTVSVLLGNGDGTFAEAKVSPLDGNPVFVRAFDANGDQRADIGTANPGGNSLTLLTANSGGTFAGQSIGLNGPPNAFAPGDFNGDGRIDLVTAHGSKLVFIPGTASGVFGAPEERESALRGPYGIAAGELNGDNRLDVIVANGSSDTVSVFFGQGNGSFLPPTNLTVSATPRHIGVADLDGDGDLDFAVICGSENRLERYKNDGKGNFTGQRKTFEVQGSDAYGLRLADVTGDGRLDALIGAYGNSRLTILRGLADGDFGSPTHYAMSGNPISVAAADFNKDGLADILTANFNGRNATLFYANKMKQAAADAALPEVRILSGRGRLLSIEDADYWAFYAATGETISLAIETGANTSSLFVRLFRPDAQQAESFYSTGAGNGQMRPYRAPVDGTYYIAVSYNHQYFGEYRWKAAITGGAVQHESENNDTVSQANAPTFAPNGSNRSARVYGFMTRDDSPSGDYYALGTVAVGTPISIQVRQPSSSAFVPSIELVKGSTVVASAVGGAELSYTVPSGGDVVLHARILGANGAKPIGVGAQYLAEFSMGGEATPPHVVSVSLPAEGGTTNQLVNRFRVQFDEEMDPRFNGIGREFAFRGASAYARTPETMTWPAAQAYAKAIGGTLVTIESVEENAWLRQQFSQDGNFWIGLNDTAAEGVLRWDSGADLSFAQWSANEPANTADKDFTAFSYWGQWFMQANANNFGVIELPAADSDGDQIPDGADPFPHDAANGFELRSAGADGLFDNSDDAIFRLLSSGYTTGLNADFLIEKGPLPPGKYRLRITQAVTDKAGNGLAEEYVRRFTIAAAPRYVLEAEDNDSRMGATILAPDPGTGADGSVTLSFQIPTGGNPYAICSADFNEDGIPDLATADYSGNSSSVLFGRGDGTFYPAANLPVERNPIHAIAGDFNKDGHKDIATANTSDGSVTILSGDGKGGFVASRHAVGTSPQWLASADFDQDGFEDIVSANYNSGNVSVIFGGTSNDRRITSHAVGSGPRTVAAGDVNGDGKADILTGNLSEGTLAYLQGDGLGGFAPKKAIAGAATAQTVRLADLNGDGKLDCLVLNSSQASMDVFFGDGLGGFQRGKSYQYGSGGNYDFVLGDVNGDNILDIVLPNYSQNQLTILVGKGAGVFGEALHHQAAGNPISAVTGDFNRDGRLDVATANYGGSTVTVFQGNRSKPLAADAALGSVRLGAGRGALLTRDDQDHWSFTATAGQTALILSETPGAVSAASLSYRLLRANGEQLTSFTSAGNGFGQSAPVVLPSTGTYLVLVSYNNEFTGEYRFQVLLSDPPARVEDEVNNTVSGANSLNFSPQGGNRRALAVGTTTPGDTGDFYALGAVPVGSPVDLTVRLGSHYTAKPKLEIYLGDKVVAAGSEGQAAISYTVPAGGEGNYYARVSAPSGPLTLDSVYQLEVLIKSETVPPVVRSVDLPEDGTTSQAVIDRFTMIVSEDLHPQVNGLNREFKRRGNSYYIFTTRSQPWLQAEAEAVALGGHLATVNDAAESDWLTEFFNGAYWIGFNDYAEEGTYVWASGEPVTYTRWSPGEPNNSGNEDFAQTYPGGAWNDLPVTSSLYGIVEVPGGTQSDSDRDGTVDAIDPYPADPLNAIDLRAAGPDGKFGGTDDLRYRVVTTGYTGGTNLSLIILNGPLPPGDYQLTVTRALSDLAGNGLAAPYVRHFTVAAVSPFVLENGSNDSFEKATLLAAGLGDPNGSFVPGRVVNTGRRQTAIATADFNGDGIPDAAAANYEQGSVSIYLGSATGELVFSENLPVGVNPYYVLAADLNRDGVADLAVANYSGASVSVLIGLGEAKFKTKLDVPVGSNPWTLALADMDRDGFPEIVSANYNSQNVTVIMGVRDWTAATTKNYAAGQNPRGLAVGDVNEDGFVDVLAACAGEDKLALLLGNASGGLELPRKIEAGNEPRFVAMADLNGDGHLDWLAQNNQSYSLDFYTGDGKGGFTQRVSTPLPTHDIYQMLLADLNADQRLDVLLVSYSPGAMDIALNQGGGVFGAPVSHSYNGGPLSAATGDFDRDGVIDILTADYSQTTLTYFHGRREGTLPRNDLLGAEIGSARGRLLDANDADYFTFSGKAGQVVTVVAETTGSPNASGLYYRLYRPGGTEIAIKAGDASGYAHLGPVTLPVDGNYFVGVAQYYGYYGEYRFRVLAAPAGAVLETEARDVIPGEPLAFTAQNGVRSARVLGTVLGPADVEFFNFGNLEPGDAITVSVLRPDSSVFPLSLALTDAEGTELANPVIQGNSVKFTVPAGLNESIYARVQSYGFSPGLYRGNFDQYSLNLDGAKDYAEVVDSAALRPKSITVEGWFSFANPTYSQVLVSKPLGKATLNSYALWYDGNSLNGVIGDAAGFVPFLRFNWRPKAGAWHHLAYVFDDAANTHSLLIDGAVVASAAATRSMAFDDHPLLIGADSNNERIDSFFRGSMDEVRIWELARTPAEINATRNLRLSGREAGLRGYWTFDEGGGSAIQDATGNNPPGRLVASPDWVPAAASFNRPGVTSQYLLEAAVQDGSGPVVTGVTLPGEGGVQESLVSRIRVTLNEELAGDFGAINRTLFTRNGHAYSITPAGMSWNGARALAASLGGYLTVIDDQAENAWVRETFSFGGNLWIGLNDRAQEGLFVWENAQLNQFTAWAASEPRDDGDEDFVAMNASGLWLDVRDFSNYRGVIEFDGPDSDRDGLPDTIDPVVLSALNYFDLREAGRDGLFDTADDTAFLVAPSDYAGGLNVDLLVLNGPLPPGKYRFTVSSAVRDRSLNPLAAPLVRHFTVEARPGFVTEPALNDSFAQAASLGGVSGGPLFGYYRIETAAETGRNPYHFTGGDLNGDGLLDVVVPNYGGASFDVFLGTADGSVKFFKNTATVSGPLDAVLADFNKDQKLDLALISYQQGKLSVFLGNGDGSFRDPVVYDTGSNSRQVVSGDFDGDGNADLASSNYSSRNVSVHFGTGLGTFAVPVLLASAGNPWGLAAGDINRDGRDDLLILTESTDQRVVALGKADRSFQVGTPVSLPGGGRVAVLADINGAPGLEAVIATQNGRLLVLGSDANGGLTELHNLSYGTSDAYDVLVTDLNNDGLSDIAVASYGASRVSFLHQRAGFTFGAPFFYTVSGGPLSLLAGDFNKDGLKDLLVSLYGDSTIGLMTSVGATALPVDAANPSLRIGRGRGTFTTVADRDYWSFHARAGDSIQAAFQSITTGGTLYGTLYSPSFETLESFNANPGAVADSGTIVAPASGLYFVMVQSTGDYPGEYALRATVVEPPLTLEKEANGSIATASPMNLAPEGNSSRAFAAGYISNPNELDYYALGSLPAGSTVYLSAQLASGANPLIPVVAIYDASNGYMIEAPGGQAFDSVAEVPITRAGNYFALVRGAGTSSGLMGQYVLEARVAPSGSLTFPNLQVASITMPSNAQALSGQLVNIRYTVRNSGASITPVASWVDRVILSANEFAGESDDTILGSFPHVGALNPGATYDGSVNVRLPDGVQGSYFILVFTDGGQQVSEFLFEGDNVRPSESKLTVVLPNYSDVVVEDLAAAVGETGPIQVSWNLANRGNGETPRAFKERIVLRNLGTGLLVGAPVERDIAQTLAAGGMLSRTLSVPRPASGRYEITVQADSADEIFEFNASGHANAELNAFSTPFNLLLVNRAPSLAQVADQTVPEDGTLNIPLVVDDGETGPASVFVTATAGNQTLVPPALITVSGVGANRVLKISPAPNLSGLTVINVKASDGLLSSEIKFGLKVSAVNDAPTVSNIGNVELDEDTSSSAALFTIGDLETDAAELTVRGESSNPNVIPASNIGILGSGAGRAVVLKPLPNAFGQATITIRVSDGQQTATRTFLATVRPVNDAPSITPIADLATRPGAAVDPIAFQISDPESATTSLVLTRTSSNPALLPVDNIQIAGSGANRTVTLTPVANEKGNARVVITVADPQGETDWAAFDFVVSEAALLITAQPESQTAADGARVEFSVKAVGTGTLRYQWFVNGEARQGAVSSTLVIDAAQFSDAGTYQVEVSDQSSSLRSREAKLRVLRGLVIESQPQPREVKAGASVTFSVKVSGAEPISYQWLYNGNILPNATSPTLLLPATRGAMSGDYSVRITNPAGTIDSTAARLTVIEPMRFTIQPEDQILREGESINLAAEVAGANIFYRWLLRGQPIAGQTGPVLTIPNARRDNSGEYRLEASDDYGTILSRAARVVVVAAPVITKQPVGQTVAAGRSTKLGVIVSGTEPLSFEWFRNGVSVAKTTEPVLELLKVGAEAAGTYTVRVSNIAGEALSSGAIIAVIEGVRIATQPASQTRRVGETATFTVEATGTALSYRWYYRGVPIPNATGPVFTISNAQITDSGVYSVEISNAAGAVRSADANLRVQAAPIITKQPEGVNGVVGGSARLAAGISGSDPLEIQWTLNGVDIAGANAPVLVLSNLQPAQDGDYRVQVRNAAGSVLSEAATVRVYGPVQIESQPVGGTIRAGAQQNLSVTASGSGPLNYQWQRNGFNIAGATSASFAAQLPGKYAVRVSNPAASVLSDAVEVRVLQPVTFRVQPAAFSAKGGESVVFRVVADGSGILTYQWQRDGSDIPGATSDTLVLRDVAGAAAGSYRVLVSNEIGSELSNAAQLTLLDPPSVLVQPIAQIINLGAPFTLTVDAQGAPPLTYQWSINGVNIPGATGPTYTLASLQPTNIGNYLVTISGPGGVVRSSPARITVQLPPLALADNRADAPQSSLAQGAFQGSNVGATREAGEPDHAVDQPATASVWLRWVAPASGAVAFTTAGSGFDTILAAYRLNGAVLEQLASDEDGGPFKTSTIQISVAQGTTYFIAVDGYNGASGEVVIAWLLQPGLPKLPRITRQPVGFTALLGGAAQFSVQAESSDGIGLAYQWFYFNQPILGQNTSVLNLPNVQIANVGSYTVSVSNASDPLFTVFSAPVQLQVNLIETQEEGPDVNTADKPNIGDRPLPQSIRNRPIRILQSVARGYTGSQVFSTIGAVRDESEPNHCNASGGASAWSLYEAPANGTLLVTTDGSAFDTVLAVYAGSADSFDAMVLMGCDNNSGTDGLDSRMVVPVTAGQLYFIVVDGVNGASGIVQLNYSLSQAPVLVQQPFVSGIQLQTVSQQVAEGAKVTMQVTATNLSQSAQSYVWKFNGVALPAGTNSTYVINAVQAANAGVYTVTVANFAGTTQSESLALEVLSPVSILAAPQNQSVPIGSSAVFTVAANGTAPIAYQWSLNGTPIPGATSPSLALNNVQTAGNYEVRVSNAANALTRQAALTVLQPVAITQQPASVAVAQNGSTTLRVTAAGSGTLGYQWRFNGVNLAGQNAPDLVLQNLIAQNGGTYSVLVTNSFSTAISADAIVSVTVPVVIVQQPRDQTISGAGTTEFEVIVSGSEPIAYQWRLNGNPIAGATSRVLVLTNLTPAQAGNYSVVINNGGAPVTSANALLTLTAPPSISQQPQNQSVAVGGSAVFTVTAAGSGTLGYQWRFNGVHIPGQTSPTLTLNTVSLAQAGEYSVAVDNSVGSVVSAAAVLQVNSPLAIVQQPVSVSAIQGGQASFSVLANGSNPIRYQWLKNEQPIAGATNDQFVIAQTTAADAGSFRVAVSNPGTTNTSSVATLTVNAVPQIVAHPQSILVNNGAPANFAVGVTGSAPMSFQWRFNGAPMAQQTNSTLQIPAAGLANEGDYSVLVSNPAGIVSSFVATLSIDRGDQVSLAASIQNNEIVLRLTGPSGRQCDVEVSADFQNWTLGGTVTMNGGQGEFRQAVSPGAFRFYRAQLRP